MAVQRTRLRCPDLRAYLVVAALISLCVSSNVGPRFLPLPAIPDDGAAISQSEAQSPSVLRQSHSEADGFRVPMLSQTQKRTDREPQQPQPIVLPVRNPLISLNDWLGAIERQYACALPKPQAVSLFLGRAPPDQV